MFILTVDSFDLFSAGGLNFLVEDHDDFSSNDLLGVASAPAKELYNAKGERLEYAFNTSGHIAIRCRRATDQDKEFLTQYEESRRQLALPEVNAGGKVSAAASDVISMIANKSKKIDGVKMVSLLKVCYKSCPVFSFTNDAILSSTKPDPNQTH